MTTPEKFKKEFHAGNVKNAMKDADAKSRDLWYVPYEKLHIEPGFNVRVKDDNYRHRVRTYADSMKANGFYPNKPLGGFVAIINGVERIVVTDGHTRYESAGIAIAEGAPLERIPVVVKSGTTSMADLNAAMVIDNSGEKLSPYETALVCKRLVDFGWDADEIAKKLTFTRTYVDQLLSLMAAPSAVQKQVREGKIAAGLAVDLVKKHGDKASEVIDKASTGKVEGGKKAKVTKKDVAKELSPKALVKQRAPKMLEALRWVMEDEGFKKLTQATRETVEEAVEGLPDAE